MRLTRRTLLLGSVSAAAVGCRHEGGRTHAPTALDATDAATVRAAVDVERRVLAAYDALLARAPAGVDVTPVRALRDGHAAHLDALRRLVVTTTAPPVNAARQSIRAALAATAPTLRDQAVAMHEGAAAAVVASVAAAHLARARPAGWGRGSWWDAARP